MPNDQERIWNNEFGITSKGKIASSGYGLQYSSFIIRYSQLGF